MPDVKLGEKGETRLGRAGPLPCRQRDGQHDCKPGTQRGTTAGMSMEITYLETFEILCAVRLDVQRRRHRRLLQLLPLPPPPPPLLLLPPLRLLPCPRLRQARSAQLLNRRRIQRGRVRVHARARDRPPITPHPASPTRPTFPTPTASPPNERVLIVRLRQLDRGRAAEQVEAEHADVFRGTASLLLSASLAGVRVQRERIGVVRGVGEEALELVWACAWRRDSVCEGGVAWALVLVVAVGGRIG